MKKTTISLIVAIIITAILIICSSCMDSKTTAADTDAERFSISDRQYFYDDAIFTTDDAIFTITDTKTDREYIIYKKGCRVIVLN